MSNLQNAARIGPSQGLTSTSTASISSTAFGSQTRYIRVQVSAGASINLRIGTGTLTAVTTDTLLNSNYPEYFLVNPGETVACIGAGTVNVTECLT
jgi:hypothetical protein